MAIKLSVVHLALGTSLACMIISSSASIRSHASRGAVVWHVVRGMAPGIILGAFLTTQVAANINSTYIAIFFALFMALIAGQMFLNWQPKPSQKPTSFCGLIVAGVGIGSAIGFPITITGTIGYMISDWSKTLSDPYTLGYIYVPAFCQYRLPALLRLPMALAAPIVCPRLI